MTGKCEMLVDPSLDRVDVQIFGVKTETLYVDSFLIEA